jgi:nicotinamide mononucleotide transporter
MTGVEIGATAASALCVFLAVHRKWISYPIGIIGTVLFFFLFWDMQLYASAALQVFFTAVQIYGWWFWLRGQKYNATSNGEIKTFRSKPPITSIKTFPLWASIIGVATVISASCALGVFLDNHTEAPMPYADSFIFGASVIAQFLLDRKKLENWFVWIAVNIASIYVYFAQDLQLTGWLYVAFLLNAGYGYYEWRKEYKTKEGLPPRQILSANTGARIPL